MVGNYLPNFRLGISLLASFLLYVIVSLLDAYHTQVPVYCQVCIKTSSGDIEYEGIYDTGNNSRHRGKPVVFVPEDDKIEVTKTGEWTMVKTISGYTPIEIGIIDTMTLQYKCKSRTVNQVTVGICKNGLDKIILHRDI